jgi:hypothetical protein
MKGGSLCRMKTRIATFIVQTCPGEGDDPTSISLCLFLGDYEKLEEKKKKTSVVQCL